MKKGALAFALLMMLNQGFAQEVKEVSEGDLQVVAQDLEKESESDKHDSKTKKLLKKVAASFKAAPQKIKLEAQKLDDCDTCENLTKTGVVFRNIGMKVGKGSAWLTTTTSKPFIQAAGFVTGVFEKKEKNQDIVALYQFFLNHSKDMDKLYVDAGTPEELAELMLAQIEVIIQKKSRIILKDTLVALGVTRELPEDLADFELTEEEIASIDFEKLSPDLINNHPEYQEVKAIVGEVTEDELNDIIMSGYFDKTIGFDNYKAAMPKIHEGVVMIVGQIMGPKIVLGVISTSLAGLYATPVILADIGTGVSTAVCLQKKNQEKFEKDKDLRAFCSYVVNRSAYQLMKSRAKGYVAGKNTRAKIEKKIAERKERRKKRQEEKNNQVH